MMTMELLLNLIWASKRQWLRNIKELCVLNVLRMSSKKSDSKSATQKRKLTLQYYLLLLNNISRINGISFLNRKSKYSNLNKNNHNFRLSNCSNNNRFSHLNNLDHSYLLRKSKKILCKIKMQEVKFFALSSVRSLRSFSVIWMISNRAAWTVMMKNTR